MRISGLANDFQKGKNINFESNDPASRQKISPQKGVSRRFRASRTAERPEYEKQSVEMKRIGNLYEKIISLDNLRLADEKARRGNSARMASCFTTKTVKRISLPCMKR